MGKRIRLKRGDIYRFELDEARFGLGQIVEPGMVFYLTVLRQPVRHDFDIAQVDTSDILLCGWTTDALFFHGLWHIVGNLPVPDDQIPKPCSKVEVASERWISDFRANLVRRATDREWEQLDFRSSKSPIQFQDAFKAYHGLAETRPHYQKIGIDHLRAQAALCSVQDVCE